jgi:hypothetical protein
MSGLIYYLFDRDERRAGPRKGLSPKKYIFTISKPHFMFLEKKSLAS